MENLWNWKQLSFLQQNVKVIKWLNFTYNLNDKISQKSRWTTRWYNILKVSRLWVWHTYQTRTHPATRANSIIDRKMKITASSDSSCFGEGGVSICAPSLGFPFVLCSVLFWCSMGGELSSPKKKYLTYY